MIDNEKALNEFAACLREARRIVRYSLLRLEIETGVNEGDLSRIENAKTNITVITFIKILGGFGIPLQRLVQFILEEVVKNSEQLRKRR